MTSVLILARGESKSETASVSRNTLTSIAVVCLSISLFIPWQVAFLGCWVVHLLNCVSATQSYTRAGEARGQEKKVIREDNANFSGHLLLLMTWLLPLVAPILAVWVRTLMTAGYTTPFNGDHNVLNVLPFLILVDFISWHPSKLFTPTR